MHGKGNKNLLASSPAGFPGPLQVLSMTYHFPAVLIVPTCDEEAPTPGDKGRHLAGDQNYLHSLKGKSHEDQM